MSTQYCEAFLLATAHGGGYVVAEVTVVHTHACPYWREGKRHAPCNCGAHELWQHPDVQAVALNLREYRAYLERRASKVAT